MPLLREIFTICILPQILNVKGCKTFYQALVSSEADIITVKYHQFNIGLHI